MPGYIDRKKYIRDEALILRHRRSSGVDEERHKELILGELAIKRVPKDDAEKVWAAIVAKANEA